jgi:hypothetical protein
MSIDDATESFHKALLESQPRAVVDQPTYTRASDLLNRMMYSQRKMDERRVMLKEHPELRRRLNPAQLHRIIDYKLFLCNPRSSVARNEAIEGSDIDGGLVVMEEAADEQTEIEFIDELRKEGFSAYTQSEYDRVRSDLERATDEGEKSRLRELENTIKHAVITFTTQKEIEQRIRSRMDNVNAVYIAGMDLDMLYGYR